MEEKELIKLIDKYIDEALTLEETEEFNDLLECSKDFRDLFRQRIRLHGDLANHYDAANVPGITPFEKSDTKKNSLLSISFLIAVAAVIALSFVINKQAFSKPTSMPIAEIKFNDGAELYSEGAVFKMSTLASGDYQLDTGMIELQMPNDVDLAIEAPAEFTLVSDTRINLTQGKISANVGEAGRGFEVLTPEGKIIDLGTRFGVSVSNNGQTEAHVFQGKINVVANKAVTELVEDQAITLHKSTGLREIRADQSSFPLPGFPLDIAFSNSDFDTSETLIVGWPKIPKFWGGDHCEVVAGTESIKPFSGSKMLQFVNTYAKGAQNQDQNVSQLWQLIDLKPFKDEVGRGGVNARLSAMFNTLESLQADDTSFTISLVAFNGDFNETKKYWDKKGEALSELLGQSSHQLRADLDNNTWEKAELGLQIPAGTDFLLIQLAANSGTTRTLEGHFVDAVKLEIATDPRRSVPMASWNGQAGDWLDKKNWKYGQLPDSDRDIIRISGTGEAIINKEVTVKQDIVLATNIGSEGHLIIGTEGVLNQPANGQFLVGYNEDGKASLLVQGKLRTRGYSFIGRNNAKSSVVIDAGEWDAEGSKVIMSQYGSRGTDTQSLLEVKNGGKFTAKELKMIHDDSVVELVDGYIEVNKLTVGGADGSAAVNHHSGILKTDSLNFGTVDSRYYFAGVEAELWLKGEWTVEQLLSIENSLWVFQGEELKKEQLQASQRKLNDKTYSVFKLK